jgi:hypothetical protein
MPAMDSLSSDVTGIQVNGERRIDSGDLGGGG